MIKWTEDLGAPLAVTAVNIIGRKSIPQYHDWLVYGMALAGYGMAYFNKGGDFMKNVGIAALPLAADKIYARITSGTVTGRSVGGRVGRYPAPAYSEEFQGLKLE